MPKNEQSHAEQKKEPVRQTVTRTNTIQSRQLNTSITLS
jgi:hypothetical protein